MIEHLSSDRNFEPEFIVSEVCDKKVQSLDPVIVLQLFHKNRVCRNI
jgi:hypothetical protein